MKKEEINLEYLYWKVVIRYGHVGKRNEVSIARHLVTPSTTTTIDVMNLVENMPGTKHRALISVKTINVYEYLQGLRAEKENFYLMRLFQNQKAE